MHLYLANIKQLFAELAMHNELSGMANRKMCQSQSWRAATCFGPHDGASAKPGLGWLSLQILVEKIV